MREQTVKLQLRAQKLKVSREVLGLFHTLRCRSNSLEIPTRYCRGHKEKSVEVFSHMTGSSTLALSMCRHCYRPVSSIGSVIISCQDFGREKEHRIDDSTKYVTALGWILEEFPVCLPPTFFQHSCNISLQ